MSTQGNSNLIFVVHDLGDWERDELNTRSERVGDSVKEYASLAEAPAAARAQFEWMLEHGEPVTQCGNTTYQIRNLYGKR